MKHFLHNKHKFWIFLAAQLYSITIFAQWNGGTGTSGNPYQIATVQQLTNLQSTTNAGTNYTNVYFKLMNNLDLGGNSWKPIGLSSNPFRGNFNGDGHTISGLYVNGTNDSGLFGYTTGATISNTGVITAPAGVNGATNVGILAGTQSGGTISNCYTMGAITGNDAVGGLVGNQTGTAPTVRQCFTIVDVTGGAGANGSGGLIGIQRGNINNSYAWGDVKGNGSVGGLVGTASSNGVTTTSYATGNTTALSASRAGGLIGNMSQGTASVQRSVAINTTIKSTNSTTGRVVGQQNAASLAGNYALDNMSVLINNMPKTITSNINGIDGESKSKNDLCSQAFYSSAVSWDISGNNDNTKMWNIWEGINLPYLQTQSSPVNGVSASGTIMQGIFRSDVVMDSISVYAKSGTTFIRLGTSNVNNSNHTWTYNDPALVMNGVLYIIAYESGKTWPSYPVSYTVCGIPPIFDTVDKVICAPAINLQTCITNLQNASINDVQFSKAGGAAFDANIISSPTTYFVNGTQTIYARATSNIGCQSIIKSFQVEQTGSLLFKEDFGSGTGCSSTPLGSDITTYTFGGDLHINGRYGICSQLSNFYNDYWHVGQATYDHTDPGDGRALIVNADFEPGKFYTLKIDNLCPGTRLNFSAWVFNLVNPNATNTRYYTEVEGVVFNDPNLLFKLTDESGTVLAEYNTGSIPKVTDPSKNWRPYSFDFVTGSSSSVTLTLYNNAPGGNGNDLMIDDIEVYLCVPPATITAPTEKETIICDGESITLEGTYTDDGTMGNNLTYRWIKSMTGNVNNPLEWTTVHTGTSTNPLNISYNIANMASTDEGYYRLLVGTSGNIDMYNCTAKSDLIYLKHKPKVSPSNINATGTTTICYGTSTNLTANITGISLTNPEYRWYDSQTATAPLFTGQIYQTPDLTATTTYYVGVFGDHYCENTENSRLPVTVTVVPLPTLDDITSVTGATICSDNTATLSATTSAGLIPLWYGDADLTDFLFEGASYTTPVLNATTTYYVIAKNSAIGCISEASEAKQAEVTVNSEPVANFEFLADNLNPFIIRFTDNSSITQGSIVSWHWDFGDNTTSALQNPEHQFASPEADHEITLTVTSNNGCTSTIIHSIHAGKTPYAQFDANNTSQCLNGNSFEFTNLSTINSDEAALVTYSWNFGDGSALSTLENPVHSYTTPGTYTVEMTVNIGSASDVRTLDVTVLPTPTVTDFRAVTTSTICAGNTASFFASVNPGFVPVWYSDVDLTDFLTEGNSYVSPVLDVSTTYYVVPKNTSTGCVGSPTAAFAATATVNPLPTINDITVNGVTICTGNSATLNAVSASGFVARWYSDAALTSFLFEGGSYTTPILTNTSTYYVVAKNIASGCIGDITSAQEVIVTVNPLPTINDITDVNGITICAENSAILTVTPASGFFAQWYADAALTTFLFEGNSYTTPILTNTTTYYVVAKNIDSGCIGDMSTAQSITVTVNPLPTGNDILQVSEASICGGNSVTLSATPASGFIARWYSDAALTTALLEGNSYTTPVLTSTTTYYVIAENLTTGCIGNAAAALPVQVAVHESPSINPVDNQIHCAGEQIPEYIFSGNTSGAQYFWHHVSGDNIQGLPQSGYDQMPAYLAVNNGNSTLTAKYEVVAGYTYSDNITCTGTPSTFAVSILPAASVTVGNHTDACSTSTTAVLSCVNNNPASPVYYKITFSDKAIAAGFQNMSDYVLLTGNTINITIPAGVNPSQYTAKLSIQNDCNLVTKTYDFVINIVGGVTITQQPQSKYILCGEHAFIRLEVKVEGENPAYQWYKDGVVINGATNSVYEKADAGVSDYGVYTVKVTNTCASVTSNPSTIAANDIAILVKWNDVLFVSRRDGTRNNLGMVSFQWYRVNNNGIMSPITDKGQSQYYAEIGLSGTFAVEVTFSDGTKKLSCPYTLVPVYPASIMVYPNPARASEKISVSLDLPGKEIKGSIIEIYNGLGKMIERKSVTNPVTEFHLNVPSGVYIFKITETDGKVTTKKVLIK